MISDKSRAPRRGWWPWKWPGPGLAWPGAAGSLIAQVTGKVVAEIVEVVKSQTWTSLTETGIMMMTEQICDGRGIRVGASGKEICTLESADRGGEDGGQMKNRASYFLPPFFLLDTCNGALRGQAKGEMHIGPRLYKFEVHDKKVQY